MKAYFSEKQKEQELNKIYLEEDDVMLFGQWLEGSEKNYIITGDALIDGENYKDFKIEFQLLEAPVDEDIESIMDTEWDWYDFLISY